VYQGQKVHLFRSESEFSGRGAAEAEQATKGTFWRPHEITKQKTSLEKFQIKLSLPFSNT
jgi:hypothetical protein